MTAQPFPDRARIDAVDKVQGAPIYAADVAVPGMLYAMMVPARIARGRVTALSAEAALRIRGVVRVLTPEDFPAPPAPSSAGGEEGPAPPPPTLESEIAYRGQPVALVVAQTLEAAIEGAEAMRPAFEPAAFSPLIDSSGRMREPVEDVTAGDATGVLASAATTIEAEYESPAPRYGGWLNNDLADYVVPVNADIGEIDVGFVDEPDHQFNAVGAKGVGEVAMVGASAALANAVFHATGRRLRALPIRVEHLL